MLRLPHFLDNRLTDGGEVVRLTRRPPFTPRNIPGTHSLRGWVDPRTIVRLEKEDPYRSLSLMWKTTPDVSNVDSESWHLISSETFACFRHKSDLKVIIKLVTLTWGGSFCLKSHFQPKTVERNWCTERKICLVSKQFWFIMTYGTENLLISSDWPTHSWSRALLEKPPIVQLLENIPAFYGTRRFITAFT
jgi:hypothetical protein